MRRILASVLLLVGLLVSGGGGARAQDYEANTDRPGSDMRQPIELEFRTNSLLTFEAECRGLCLGDRRCKAWTMVKPGVQGRKARCYLKNQVPQAVRNGCCSSGLASRSTGGGTVGSFNINAHLNSYFANATTGNGCNQAFGQCHAFAIAHFGLPSGAGIAAAECQRRLVQCVQRVAGGSGSGGSGDASSQWTEVLNLHNSKRAMHGTPALAWSSSLATQAQAWAGRCSFSHANFNGFGENLYWGTNASGRDAVEWWYNEVRFYDWNNPTGSYNQGDSDRSREVRHFTQVVWRATTTLGCGMAACSGRNYVVCRYTPPGNFNANNPGVLQQNVLPRR